MGSRMVTLIFRLEVLVGVDSGSGGDYSVSPSESESVTYGSGGSSLGVVVDHG
jgi:hypothetical protein